MSPSDCDEFSRRDIGEELDLYNPADEDDGPEGSTGLELFDDAGADWPTDPYAAAEFEARTALEMFVLIVGEAAPDTEPMPALWLPESERGAA
jgi:hypothetical protein